MAGGFRITPLGAKLRHLKLDEYRNIQDKGQIQDICKDAEYRSPSAFHNVEEHPKGSRRSSGC